MTSDVALHFLHFSVQQNLLEQFSAAIGPIVAFVVPIYLANNS